MIEIEEIRNHRRMTRISEVMEGAVIAEMVEVDDKTRAAEATTSSEVTGTSRITGTWTTKIKTITNMINFHLSTKIKIMMIEIIKMLILMIQMSNKILESKNHQQIMKVVVSPVPVHLDLAIANSSTKMTKNWVILGGLQDATTMKIQNLSLRRALTLSLEPRTETKSAQTHDELDRIAETS